MRARRAPWIAGRWPALAGALLLAAAGLPGARAQSIHAEKPAAHPVPPPLPPQRPEDLKAVPERPASEKPANEMPLPPERPAELKPAAPEPSKTPEQRAQDPKTGAASPEPLPTPPLPPARPPELSGEAALALKVAAADDTACRRRLTRLGATFEALPALENGQCGAARPLRLTALDGVALPQSVTLVCGAAEALARWTTEVQVAAERDLGQPLKALTIGTSYECRGQNHDPDAKLSEHAFANGVDVMSFSAGDRPPIGVGPLPAGTNEARFLAGVRARACDFFRTVLGPGSDAAHANHLHLDERERNAGHRLCQ
ncbi:extensin family protein [Methylobacterium planeticum]|uniref:Extensin family protein n=1 Tax=Methylobacterium planeticum TaxID=2615211 RepID=A0A6N6MVM8_9HYPH|nr:extensin family protein [Methylobacterium planeticum]KAB1074766.1 extensin family protein [Methylobacterium planeticum]